MVAGPRAGSAADESRSHAGAATPAAIAAPAVARNRLLETRRSENLTSALSTRRGYLLRISFWLLVPGRSTEQVAPAKRNLGHGLCGEHSTVEGHGAVARIDLYLGHRAVVDERVARHASRSLNSH